MRTTCKILTLRFLIILLCAMTLESNAWWSAPFTTHSWITKDALGDTSISDTEYPDLRVTDFITQLRTGSNTESHDVPDNTNVQWWAISPKIWFYAERTSDDQIGAFSSYTNYDFSGAYLRIGYELHLLQDERVPAHKYYCAHGRWGGFETDNLEAVADYEKPFSYGPPIPEAGWIFTWRDNKEQRTFLYWLDDSMDDDNTNEVVDADDEWYYDKVRKENVLIPDGPTNPWGVANTDWGTYGRPKIGIFSGRFLENLPGLNDGVDSYGNKDLYGNGGNLSIVQGQLQLAYNDSLARLKERSEELPPLIPDDDRNGKPKISLNIFGPNKPVVISFVAMENRKPTVFVSVLAGTAGGIKDRISKKVWDGGVNATIDLLPSNTLPWKRTIISNWNGDMGTKQIDDGEHVITMQVKDQDKKFSEKRTRTVKFDKTPPEATITFRDNPKVSYP